MSDKIKEFINTTYTLADVVDGKLPIVTTGANTQAVVKNVYVTNNLVASNNITVNGVVIADTESLEGSEILDVNSQMAIEVNSPYGLPIGISIDRSSYTATEVSSPLLAYSTSASAVKYNGVAANSKLRLGEKGVTSVTGSGLTESGVLSSYGGVLNTTSFPDYTAFADNAAATSTSGSVITMTSPQKFSRHSSGRVYYHSYNGNDGTYFHTAASIGASWSTISTSSYTYWAHDSKTEIWSAVNGTSFIRVLAGGTSLAATVALSGRGGISISASTYTHAAACNGWHFWTPDYSTTTTALYGYNAVKNIAIIMSTSTPMRISSNGGLAVTYNQVEDRYYVVSYDNNVLLLHRTQVGIDSLVADSALGVTLSYIGVMDVNARATLLVGMTWVLYTNKLLFIDNTTYKVMSTELNNGTYSTPVVYLDETVTSSGTCPTISGVTTADTVIAAVHVNIMDYLDTTQSVSVRATGVETILV